MRTQAQVCCVALTAALGACPVADTATLTRGSVRVDSVEAGATTTIDRDPLRRPATALVEDTSTIPPADEEGRFKREAHCHAPTPGIVRGLLEGRFDEPGQAPVDTILRGTVVVLSVAPSNDTATMTYYAKRRTGDRGHYYFRNVPATGHYQLEVWSKSILGFRFDIGEGFVEDIQARCILPSIVGRIPLDRRQQQLLLERGLLN